MRTGRTHMNAEQRLSSKDEPKENFTSLLTAYHTHTGGICRAPCSAPIASKYQRQIDALHMALVFTTDFPANMFLICKAEPYGSRVQLVAAGLNFAVRKSLVLADKLCRGGWFASAPAPAA